MCAGGELNPYPTHSCVITGYVGDNTRNSAPALPHVMPFPCCLDSRFKPWQEHCMLLPGGLKAAPPRGSSPPIAFPLRAASSPGVIPGQRRASRRRFCSSSAEFTPRSGSVVALAAPAAPERLNFSKLSPRPPAPRDGPWRRATACHRREAPRSATPTAAAREGSEEKAAVWWERGGGDGPEALLAFGGLGGACSSA